MGRKSKSEGLYVFVWLIHFAIQLKIKHKLVVCFYSHVYLLRSRASVNKGWDVTSNGIQSASLMEEQGAQRNQNEGS